MASAEEKKNAVERYIALVSAGDVDGIVSLYAEDAMLEDPVGSSAIQGHDAIRAFYARATKMGIRLEPTGPVRLAGREAAFPFRVTTVGGPKMTIDVIDVFRFDDAGKIAEMRAYWGRENMTMG
jgi:steroid Delta-isomerase